MTVIVSRQRVVSAGQSPGQSLVEFAFASIVLFAVLAAAFYVGRAMLLGNAASEGIREPAMRKMEMADTPGAIGTATILGWTTEVDNVQFVATGATDVTSIIVGERTTDTNYMGMPNFTFTVTQGLQKNLLKAVGAPNHGTNWFPNTFHGHPFDFMQDNRHQQLAGLEYVGGCQDRTAIGGEGVVQFLAGGDSVPYVSRSPIAYSSPFKLISFLQLAETFRGECAGVGAGKCNQAAGMLTFTEKVEALGTGDWPDCMRGVTCGGDDENLCPKVLTGNFICPPGTEQYGCNASDPDDIWREPEEVTQCPPGSLIDDGSSDPDCEPRAAGSCLLSNPGECAATGNKMLTITLENPPGAAGLRFQMQKVPCQDVNVNVSELYDFEDLELGVYQQDGYKPQPGQGPPPGFIPACLKRKQAECMLRKADERAMQLMTEFNQGSGECKLL